jgi:glycosyltransferase involved in cell wall biosynthesis
MKILFISRWYPYPPDNGSKIRIFNLITLLSLRHQIYLVSFASEMVREDQLAALRPYCQQIDIVRYRSFQPNRTKALLGFFSSRPRSVIDTYSFEMKKLVEGSANRFGIDLVIASEIDTAPYALSLSHMPKILDEIQLTIPYEQFVNQSKPLKKLRNWLTWLKLSRYIRELTRSYNGCVVVSEQECLRVSDVISPGSCTIRVIPNGVDTSFYTNGFQHPEPDTLIYSGALTYEANFDAIDYFLRKIFPLIRAKRPTVKLVVTGKVEGVPLDRLSNTEGVIFTGYLDDIRSAVARSWVSIVPLRIGGGTRLKILEAMSLGVPVVATNKGAEGLGLVPERDLLTADRSADFAAAVLRLLQDPELRERLSYNGRRVVEAKYNWQMIGQQFDDFIETVFSETR